MTVNAAAVGAGLESSITADRTTSASSGRFSRRRINFEGYVKDMKPADMAGWDIADSAEEDSQARLRTSRLSITWIFYHD